MKQMLVCRLPSPFRYRREVLRFFSQASRGHILIGSNLLNKDSVRQADVTRIRLLDYTSLLSANNLHIQLPGKSLFEEITFLLAVHVNGKDACAWTRFGYKAFTILFKLCLIFFLQVLDETFHGF